MTDLSEKNSKKSQPKEGQDVAEANKSDLEHLSMNSDLNEIMGEMDLNIEEATHVTPASTDNPLVNPFSITDEKRYITDLIKAIQKNKERILSSLSNVKTSRVFELTGNSAENKNVLTNFSREFESEIIRILENLQNKFKEIASFPKSINHYSMNYSLVQKDFLSSLENDKMRLEYVLRWEMQEPSLILVKKFAKMVTDLLDVLNTKEDDQIKTLSYQQQTLFRDAKTATNYCLNDLDFLKRSIENWEQSAV